MGAGAYLEPLAVITLLFGGAWVNRARDDSFSPKPARWHAGVPVVKDGEDFDSNQARLTPAKRSLSPSLLPSQEHKWRQRDVKILGRKLTLNTPNTAVFRNTILSRLLRKFPFLVEAWYWALIYWVSGLLAWISSKTHI